MTSSHWPAPLATDPLDAVVEVPGSKSLTNRYLILAALSDAPSFLRAPLQSRDTLLMAEGLRTLGVQFSGEKDWTITPPTQFTAPAAIDCGLAGTVMRFMPAVAALARGDVTLDGDAQARKRPMGPIVDSLRKLGVSIDAADGRLPVTIHGTGRVKGGQVDVDASASSQFVSGLLLAGSRFDEGLTLRHVGETLPSLPHIEMTVNAMREAGIIVDDSEPNVWVVHPGPVSALDVRVEPDLSNAGPFLAAALVSGGTVRVPGWPDRTNQAGDHLRHLLDAMGAEVHLSEAELIVRGVGDLHGIDANLHDVGELTPVIAALAALADSPSRLAGVAHLRGHETDRLAALVTEINALGGDATELEDGLLIRPRTLHGGVFHSYHDHRMATAGAVIGLKVPGIEVENVATTQKTLPDFPGMWEAMIVGAPTPPAPNPAPVKGEVHG